MAREADPILSDAVCEDKAGKRPGDEETAQTTTTFDVVVLIFGVVGFGVVAVRLGQDANWDFKNYHFYNGYAYLTGRYARDIGPGQLQTFLNPVMDAATYLVTAWLPPRAFGFVLGALHGLAFWLSYRIAQRAFARFDGASRTSLAFLCALLGACGAAGLSELGTTFHDATTSTFVLASLLVTLGLLTGGPQRPRSLRTRLAIAGLLLGLGVGLKLTLAVFGIGLFLLIATSGAGWRAAVERVAIWGAGALAGVGVVAGHWMYFLTRRFGSPLFPFYNALFKSPYWEPINFVDFRYQPGSVSTHLLYPFLFTQDGGVGMELRFQDLRFAAVYLLAGIVLVAMGLARLGRRGWMDAAAGGSKTARSILIFFFVSYVLWQKQFGNYRYVVTLEHLAPLVIAILMSKLVGIGPRLIAACALPFALIAVLLRVPDWGRIPWGGRVVDVAAPKLAAPSRTTVLMASSEPMSYAIAAFPEEVTFVRVESNMFQPGLRNKMADDIRSALARRDREYYLLTMTSSRPRSSSTVAWYDFEVDEPSCKTLKSNLELDPANSLEFCALRRTAGTALLQEGGTVRPSGKIWATPNPLPVCRTTGLGEVTIGWDARGVQRIALRIGTPGGDMFISGGPSGTARTGKWAAQGTTIYLQDASQGASDDPKRTLSHVVIAAVDGPCP